MRKLQQIPIWIFIIVIFSTLSLATSVSNTYCHSQLATSSVYVQYFNYTPALEAQVTITLFNGTVALMQNMGDGTYNYTFTTPSFNIGGPNTYYNYFNSSNPNSTGVEDFTISENCVSVVTNTTSSNLGVVIALFVGILILGGFTYYFAQMHHPLSYMFIIMDLVMLNVIFWLSGQLAKDAGYAYASVFWTLYRVSLVITFFMIVVIFIEALKYLFDIQARRRRRSEFEQYGYNTGGK